MLTSKVKAETPFAGKSALTEPAKVAVMAIAAALGACSPESTTAMASAEASAVSNDLGGEPLRAQPRQRSRQQEGAKWLLVSVGPVENPNTATYLDPTSVVRNGNLAYIWGRNINAYPVFYEGSEYSDALIRYRFDCAVRTSTLEQVSLSLANGSTHTFSPGDMSTLHAPPDSPAEAQMNIACSGAPSNARLVADPKKDAEAVFNKIRSQGLISS
jgi:hypothetical protein